MCFAVGITVAHSASATANVYYSVGQSASNLLAGTSVTVNITAGSGVFNVAQSGNIGVGDKVTYDSDNKVAYIAGKTNSDQKNWTLVTKTGGTAPDTSGSVTVTSIAHAYSSLQGAVAGASDSNHINNTDLTAADVILNIPCYMDSGTADTTAVTITGYTTDATRYIRIYTPNNTSTEANNSQRHQGKWDDSKYKLNVSGGYIRAISNYISYTIIDGLQVTISYSMGTSRGFYNYAGGSNSIVRNSIFVGNPTADTSGNGIEADSSVSILNNIIYNFRSASNYGRGIYGYASSYVYNNTIANCGIGLYGGYHSVVAKNNIAYNNNDNYYVFEYSYWPSGGTNNLSGPGTDAQIPATNAKNGYTVNFVDSANYDFHLAPTDTGAKDHGTNLSSDSNLPFSTDIDGQNRPGTWDIGADETTTEIFYSVGQNTAPHMTLGAGGSAPTLTLSGYAATLNVGQTAPNMGVGDLITYTGGSCYITAKTNDDQMHWNCQNATGGTAPQVSGVSVTSITHAFSSLSGALPSSSGGAKGASYLNTTDLYTGNYVLNVPCYYDTGPDTSAVTINGWTTAANNYIKVYTPTNTSTEANNSQRHQGKWDEGKYRLGVSNSHGIDIKTDYARIDGLQVKITASSGSRVGIYTSSQNNPSDIRISNNIVYGALSGGISYNMGITCGSSATARVWNNIVYGFLDSGNTNYGIYGACTAIYAYNNTVVNNYRGLDQISGTFVSKNNLAYNNTDNYYGTFAAGSANNLSGPSSDSTIAGQTAPQNGVTVSFVDAANSDFHLAESDTSARNAGADLSADTYLPFSTDIDGQTRNVRANLWDIGADEVDRPSVKIDGRGKTEGTVKFE